jgi:hypothetical protein
MAALRSVAEFAADFISPLFVSVITRLGSDATPLRGCAEQMSAFRIDVFSDLEDFVELIVKTRLLTPRSRQGRNK